MLGLVQAAPPPPPGGPSGPRGFPVAAEPTRLLREFLIATDAFESRLARDLEVNATDLSAMEHLIAAGSLSPSELARRLGLSTAATTTVIDRLGAVGHVSRAADPSDRRRVAVVPAEASVARAIGMLAPLITEVDRVLDEFDEAERAVIASYLRRVVEVYRAHGGPPALVAPAARPGPDEDGSRAEA